MIRVRDHFEVGVTSAVGIIRKHWKSIMVCGEVLLQCLDRRSGSN
jgi:hypothetical protein